MAGKEIVELVSFLQFAQTVTKILHWKTGVFSQHIALDELYDTLSKYADMIAEASMGIDNNVLTDIKAQEYDLSQTDVKLFIRQLAEKLQELVKPVSEVSDALESTVDDMMQQVYTSKYKIEKLS